MLNHRLIFRARACVIFAMTVLTASAALAQSSSSSSSDLKYSFALDPNSTAFASDLTVTDDGLSQYNLINSNAGPYTLTSGSGSASTNIGGATQYSGATWSGENQISSSAGEGIGGAATASIGSQEVLTFKNSGTSTISLDITALALVTGSVSATGPTTSSNFAQVDTYAGIYDFDLTTGTAIANPLVHLSGAADTGVSTSLTGDWTPEQIGGQTYYSESYVLNVAPSESHIVEFYASGKNVTSAVPEPKAILPFLVGLVGVASFRRKSRFRIWG
jgi:hypothetical protein